MKELSEKELREADGGIFLLALAIPYALQALLVGCLAAGVYASFKSGCAAVQ